MTPAVLFKLLAMFSIVGMGWVAGRLRWLGDERAGADPARVLSQTAFYLFIPALLFRTMARIDLALLPVRTLAGFFVPLLMGVALVYAWHRRHRIRLGLPAAGPAVRAITANFGNTLQVGIPMAAALYGEAGLAIHLTLISLHALTLLTVLTTLVELDLAREGAPRPLAAVLATTVRNTVIHPVVLPVLAGLAWSLAGLPLPAALDEVLATLASAVVPVCLVLIGVSLGQQTGERHWRGVATVSAFKLLALPALVWAVAHFVLGLSGLALSVVVMAAALPVGANAVIFSQRYRVLEAETTTASVLSTFAFAATAPLWLALLARWA